MKYTKKNEIKLFTALSERLQANKGELTSEPSFASYGITESRGNAIVKDAIKSYRKYFPTAEIREHYAKQGSKAKRTLTVTREPLVVMGKRRNSKLTPGRHVRVKTLSGVDLGGGVVRDRRGQHIKI
jgi:hypothetical protein